MTKNRLSEYWNKPVTSIITSEAFVFNPLTPWLMTWQAQIYQAAFEQAQATA